MMRLSFLLLNKYYPSDHIKKNEIDEAYGTYGERRDTYIVLVGKPEGKKTLGRPWYTREDNIKVNVYVRGWLRRLE